MVRHYVAGAWYCGRTIHPSSMANFLRYKIERGMPVSKSPNKVLWAPLPTALSTLTRPQRTVQHQVPPHRPHVYICPRIGLDPAPRPGRAVAVRSQRQQHAKQSGAPYGYVEAAHEALLLVGVVHAKVHRDIVQDPGYRHRPQDLSHLLLRHRRGR